MATPIPPNQARFTLRELVQATGAVLLEPVGKAAADRAIRGVCTDSRAALEGKLFVALSGERFDAHDFVGAAVARGAAAGMVERDGFAALPVPVLRVASVLRALGEIARCARNRWQGRVVAVAGSAGKTTTRVAIETLLASALGDRVHATRGNLNNLVGVPMTLLGLSDHHEVAVIEVGTNRPGEVARLAEICRPDVAVLTLIGLEHSEGLGDLDGIEVEEGRILQALNSGGRAIGNGDDVRVMAQLDEHVPVGQRFTYGARSELDYRAAYRISDALDRTHVVVTRSQRAGGGLLELQTRLLGLPGAMAVTAAVAAADLLGVPIDADQANAALLRSDLGESGRLKAHVLADGTVVLDDTYNANPPSMTSSIALANDLALRRSARLVLVLGEMLELGEFSVREHEALGVQLGEAKLLIAVGEQAEPLHRSARRSGKHSIHVCNAQDAAHELLKLLQPGDVVLAKGSRGGRLETVVTNVMAQKGFTA